MYKPFKSTRKNNEYDIYVLDNNNKRKKISFGDTRYQHYFDKLGKYKHLNHKDKKIEIIIEEEQKELKMLKVN